MSSSFFRLLLAALSVSTVAFLGFMAHANTSTPDPEADGVAPHIVSLRADAAPGEYRAGSSIGLLVKLSEPARGELLAYLSTGTTVALTCDRSVCSGRYHVLESHAAERLDVLFFAGRLVDQHGNETVSPTWPAGAGLADTVALKIGNDAARASAAKVAGSAADRTAQL